MLGARLDGAVRLTLEDRLLGQLVALGAVGDAVGEARLVLGRVGGGALRDTLAEASTRAGVRARGGRVGVSIERRADLAVTDVAEETIRITVDLLDLSVVTRGLVAAAAWRAELTGRDRVRVGRIEPDHPNLCEE